MVDHGAHGAAGRRGRACALVQEHGHARKIHDLEIARLDRLAAERNEQRLVGSDVLRIKMPVSHGHACGVEGLALRRGRTSREQQVGKNAHCDAGHVSLPDASARTSSCGRDALGVRMAGARLAHALAHLQGGHAPEAQRGVAKPDARRVGAWPAQRLQRAMVVLRRLAIISCAPACPSFREICRLALIRASMTDCFGLSGRN